MYLSVALKVGFFINLLIPATLLASTTQPAATPSANARPASTSAPSTLPLLDQSSPKALLRSFYASRGEVDEATIRSLLYASDPVEQKVLNSLVQVELAHARLRAAEREKFGHAATRPSVASSLKRPSLSEADSFVEKIDGDHATVSTPGPPIVSMQVVRINGKWTIPISSLVGKLDPSIAETLGASTAAQVQIIDAMTAEVRAGKWTNGREVRSELNKRLEQKIAATRPATLPAATNPGVPPTTAPHK